MARIAVFEPAGCCATGVCDPSTSDVMAQFASAMQGLNEQGIEVERYELSSRPDAFATNETVKAMLETDGVECLPLIIVDGKIVSKGVYLDKKALGDKVGIEITGNAISSCCGPADDKETKKTPDNDACCG
jgi:disulfide oxidoreductase YuzD